MIEANDMTGMMVWLMNFFAEEFGDKAILKGGMELRLLDCPRHTNDIDYVFVPFTSKKEVSNLVLERLCAVPELKVNKILANLNELA